LNIVQSCCGGILLNNRTSQIYFKSECRSFRWRPWEGKRSMCQLIVVSHHGVLWAADGTRAPRSCPRAGQRTPHRIFQREHRGLLGWCRSETGVHPAEALTTSARCGERRWWRSSDSEGETSRQSLQTPKFLPEAQSSKVALYNRTGSAFIVPEVARSCERSIP